MVRSTGSLAAGERVGRAMLGTVVRADLRASHHSDLGNDFLGNAPQSLVLPCFRAQ
jgi:hypothetical protein